jgi:hypothetical protein
VPDLTFETARVCASMESYKATWHEGGYDQHLNHEYEVECSCAGYKYRRTCKHSRAVEESRCTWHSMYSDESQTVEQEANQVCPVCGGPTIYARVAV